MSVTHAKISAKSDGGDATLIQPSDWNTAHLGALPVYNVVTDHGAVGNGTADDTEALQAAIDAAVAAGGGIVYLPAGTYKITAALTSGLMVGVTLRGAGMGVSIIRQFTLTVPILRFDTAECVWVTITDLTLMYDDFATLLQTGAVAIAFHSDSGSKQYHNFLVSRVAIFGSNTCIGYTGTATQTTYDMTWDNLWLHGFSHKAFHMEATTAGIGQPGHRFTNLLIEISNTVPDGDPAIIWLQGMYATFDNLVVANSRNAILYAFGNSHINIRGLHVEGFVMNTDYTKMFGLGDQGFLSIDCGIVDGTNTGSDTSFFAYADAGDVVLRNIEFDVTMTSGDIQLVRAADAGATFRLTNIYDRNANIGIPFISAYASWAPQVREWDNDFPSGEIGLGFDTARVRVITGAGSPEGAVVASPGSIYLNISGGTGTSLYVKEAGTSDTGWVAK